MTLSTIKKTLFKPFGLLLILGYILFEEIVWNTIAKPIFEYLKHLAILDSLKQTFLDMNRYLLVSVFVVILGIAEYMGILSLLMVAQNQVAVGVFIYALKIPLASFTFWLFELTKPRLMTFAWLKATYEALMKGIDFIKHSAIYVGIKTRAQWLKAQIKSSPVFQVLLMVYKRIKAAVVKVLFKRV